MLCTTSYFFRNTQYEYILHHLLPNRTNVICIKMLNASQDDLSIFFSTFVSMIIVRVAFNELLHTVAHCFAYLISCI